MIIAVSGKGGVGKTTFTATMARILADRGYSVIAVDADPDANLAAAIGFTAAQIEKIQPIAQMTDLIEERTGARPGSMGGVFKLNPEVSDIPETYSLNMDHIRLLTLGRAKKGGAGCYCPEGIFLKRLLGHLILQKREVVLLDMEAGIEHLSRGTTGNVDAFIVVVEPGKRSLQTASDVRRMAADLGVKSIYVVGNKVASPAHLEFLKENFPGEQLLGSLSYDRSVIDSDLSGTSPYDRGSEIIPEVSEILDILLNKVEKQPS
ncbi:MAG: carbon monoxide dehydrogenase accessory protein CooC [bacterium]|nr:carbon monoxide dehydrogenase accessory protein CooC [bacterium]